MLPSYWIEILQDPDTHVVTMGLNRRTILTQPLTIAIETLQVRSYLSHSVIAIRQLA